MLETPHLGEALEAAVALGPDREAIVADGVRWTYRQLAREADAVAAGLRSDGVREGERVGMVLGNVPQFASAFFGIARAGAIALPLHPEAPPSERARRFAADGVRVVLGEVPRVPGPVGAAIRPDTPVLTQYSSGQNGGAKRVTRTHGQLVRETAHLAEALSIGPTDRILGAVPLFHAYGLVNALLASLLTGATLVLLDPADLLPRDLLRTLVAERITGFPGVPFLFDALVAGRLREDLVGLRYCTSAGAPLSAATAAAFAERFGRPVSGLYGTTETGVISVDRDGSGSVGTPIRGVSIEVRDGGEVAIRSETAASRYDQGDDPAFAHGAFLPGDLGHHDPAGRLVLTGRTRPFVNVGGNKVDPTEVEEVLRSAEGVADVAVVGVPDPVGGERVVAVVVVTGEPDRDRLLSHCRAHLAPYKVPTRVRFRWEIPRSALGKVLRRDLVDEEG